jgi:ABC-2 type transport system permease protein
MSRIGVSNGLRMIWTIASKDIIDAIRNRTTISIMFGIGLLILNAQALPILMKFRSEATLVVAEPIRSERIGVLAKNDDFQLARVLTPDDIQRSLGSASEVQIGIVLPDNFDAIVSAGESLKLDGYYAYWPKMADIEEKREFFEDKLGAALGVPVDIEFQDSPVYPSPDADGQPFMISLSLVVAVITIGAFLVPYLIVEEREKHTMEALMVSPANFSQVIVGKAITGIFYCLTAAAVVFVMNLGLISLWWLAILGVLSGALFTASLGLLIGTRFANPASMNLWLGLVLIVILIPVMVGSVIPLSLPEFFENLLPLIPSVAMSNTIRMSFSNTVLVDQLLRNILVLVGESGLLLAATVWNVRRFDRG